MTEDQLQASIWTQAWNLYPEARRCMWAVPNGSTRHPLEAAKLRATGLLAGVFDMHLYWAGQLYLFEFKVGTNQLTHDYVDSRGRKHFGQKEWGLLMEKQCAICHVIRDRPDDFMRIFHSIIRPNTPNPFV